MWAIPQIHQASHPVSRQPPNAMIASPRPIVASLPRSRYRKGGASVLPAGQAAEPGANNDHMREGSSVLTRSCQGLPLPPRMRPRL
jgi:hypothetical protein